VPLVLAMFGTTYMAAVHVVATLGTAIVPLALVYHVCKIMGHFILSTVELRTDLSLNEYIALIRIFGTPQQAVAIVSYHNNKGLQRLQEKSRLWI